MTKGEIIVQIEDQDVLELIPAYLESRRADLDALKNASQKMDFETVRGIGHKMKGSGGGYGFHPISEIGGKLEFAAKVQDLPGIEQQIADLLDYLNRVEVVGI